MKSSRGWKMKPDLVDYVFGLDLIGSARKRFLFGAELHLLANVAVFSPAGQAFGD